jgi:hypothetical protein
MPIRIVKYAVKLFLDYLSRLVKSWPSYLRRVPYIFVTDTTPGTWYHPLSGKRRRFAFVTLHCLSANKIASVENTNMTECISILQSVSSDKHLPQSPFKGQVL